MAPSTVNKKLHASLPGKTQTETPQQMNAPKTKDIVTQTGVKETVLRWGREGTYRSLSPNHAFPSISLSHTYGGGRPFVLLCTSSYIPVWSLVCFIFFFLFASSLLFIIPPVLTAAYVVGHGSHLLIDAFRGPADYWPWECPSSTMLPVHLPTRPSTIPSAYT